MSKNFGTMDPERQREIARQGGLAAHASGHGRRWTTEEARDAARKGGLMQAAIPGRMRELGRKGAARRKAKNEDTTV